LGGEQGSRLARGAVTLWVAAFVGFLGTTVTTHHEPMRMAAFWLYGLPVVIAALYGLLRRPSALDLPVIGAVVVYTLVAWVSTDRIASMETVPLVVAYVSVLLVAARVTSPAWRSAIATGVTLPAAIWLLSFALVWVADLAEWIALGGGVPPHIARSAHMWLGTDLVAVLLLLSVPFYPWIRWRALRRVLIAATLIAAVAVVPMSDARTTWIAALVAGIVVVALSRDFRERFWPRHGRAVIAGGLLLAAGLAAAVLTGSLGTLSGRANIWETALATFRSSPIVGTGPGTFSWTRLAEAPPLLEPYPVFHAHDVVLQTLADGGIVLLVGLGVAVIGWLVVVAPATQRLEWRSRVGLGVLAGFVLVTLLEEPAQLPALAAMAMTLAGWTAADATRASTNPWHWPWRWSPAVLPIAFASAALMGLPSALAASQARTAAAEARAAAVAEDWVAAYASFERANERWPDRAAYELGLGLAAAQVGSLAEAKVHYESARRLSPGDPRAPGALAALSGDLQEQARLLDNAAMRAFRDPQYSYRLAAVLWELGREQDAAHAAARAAMVDPQVLVTLSSETGVPLDRVIAALPGVLESEAELAAVDADSVLAQAEMVGGRSVEEPPALAALSAARDGDLERARRAVQEALATERLERRTYDVGIAVAEARCDEAEAERLRRLSEIVPGGFTSLYRIGADIRESRDHVYREMGLGDYQPPGTDGPSASPYDWPRALVAGIGCVGEQGD
jgi:tetratricopeptide (TPR) repeat protein